MTTATTKTRQIATLNALRVERNAVDARSLTALALLCESYASVDPAPDGFILAGEQFVRPGADGTPPVAETLELEIAIALHISPEAARAEIAAVLNLRHRHRLLWEQAITGQVPAWVAKQVATRCHRLSADQAARFDADWAQRMGHWSTSQILSHTDREIPQLLGSTAEEQRRLALTARRVEITVGEPGIARLDATLDATAAHHLDATLNTMADVLRGGGSTDSRDQLRADALGHLAHPDRARHLLSPSLLDGASVTPAGDVVNRDGEIVSSEHERCRHGAELIVHLRNNALAEDRGGDSPQLGPVLRAQLDALLQQCGGSVRVRPVIDLAAPAIVTTYSPSADLARRVKLRDERVLFPYSNRSAHGRGVDLDHTMPYPEGRTELINLAPLTRRPHRAKTHLGFRCTQPSSGVLHWTTPAGQEAWVSRHGVWHDGPPDLLINEPGMVELRLAELIRGNHALATQWLNDTPARSAEERDRRRASRANKPPPRSPAPPGEADTHPAVTITPSIDRPDPWAAEPDLPPPF